LFSLSFLRDEHWLGHCRLKSNITCTNCCNSIRLQQYASLILYLGSTSIRLAYYQPLLRSVSLTDVISDWQTECCLYAQAICYDVICCIL